MILQRRDRQECLSHHRHECLCHQNASAEADPDEGPARPLLHFCPAATTVPSPLQSSPMRLLVTDDLHYDHGKSQGLADEVIGRINRAGGDVLLVVGDTAVADGDGLERCLAKFKFAGPKLFVAGNHELWTHGTDSYELFTSILPARITRMGWHWLEGEPYVAGDVAVVGSVGWYDYLFAPENLKIPMRFYEAKVSPGAAERFEEFAHLFHPADDIPPEARQVMARWNDGKFVKLRRSDEAFLRERLDLLQAQLELVAGVPRVVAAVHHLPFRELLPPQRNPQWDFARAFLGSERIGELLLRFPNVTRSLLRAQPFPRRRAGRPHSRGNTGKRVPVQDVC